MKTTILCLLCLCGLVSGCASDGLALKAVTRNEQVWKEDRRPVATTEEWAQWTKDGNEAAKAAHLDPELATAREAEFTAQKRAFGGK